MWALFLTTMQEASNKNNRLNNIIADLGSGDIKKVLTAIKQLRKHGKPEAIFPLLKVLITTQNDDVKQGISAFLVDLKDQQAIAPLIDAIQEKQFEPIKNQLLSVFWQSPLDASEHLLFFVRQAIEGDYLTAMEVFSIIDNYNGVVFQEDEINDAVFDLEEAIDLDNTEKSTLLLSIKNEIQQLTVEF